MSELRKEENQVQLPKEEVKKEPISNARFVLKLHAPLPENPSYNDLVVWAITRKSISISQKEYAELPVTVQSFFEIK